MKNLEDRRLDLQNSLAAETAVPNDILPTPASIYKNRVEVLIDALNNSREQNAASEALRSLIEKITIEPGEDPDVTYATIHGEYCKLLLWLADRSRQTKTPLAFASGVCVRTSDQTSDTPEGML
ncbi:MAG: hypothetical protein QM647_09330 [Asticcacaulis sp.]|uniref:hypothetical protein n=1 Tax=Asticcacaulis sp. TaxID=1872648 RepID=UPI0039E69004